MTFAVCRSCGMQCMMAVDEEIRNVEQLVA